MGLGPGDNWSIISWVLVSLFEVVVAVMVMVADIIDPLLLAKVSYWK